MKKTLFIWFSAICIVSFVSGPACAEWGKCVVCHFGVFAPSKETLKEKFKTKDDFVNAALKSESSMMDPYKKKSEKLHEAVKELGYTEPVKKTK